MCDNSQLYLDGISQNDFNMVYNDNLILRDVQHSHGALTYDVLAQNKFIPNCFNIITNASGFLLGGARMA